MESKQTIGTTFNIYFKPCVSVDENIPDNNKKVSDEKELQGNNSLVLVVEDEDSVREFVEYILKSKGYRVVSVSNGSDGFEAFLKYRNEIKILIVDVIMPGMSGKELIDKVLEIEPKIKYLFMSGYTDDILGKHGIVGSEINIIQKPFDRALFLSKIKNLTLQ